MGQLSEALLRICVAGVLYISTTSSLHVGNSKARVLITEDRSVDDGYLVSIEANGETRHLQMTLMENIWSDIAQSLIISRDENGEQIIERENVPKGIKVYHNEASKSVMSIKNGKLFGMMDHEYVIQSDEEGNHFIKKLTKNPGDAFDYLKIPDTLPDKTHRGILVERNISNPVPIPLNEFRQIDIHYPEIAVLVDSALASKFPNNADAYEYLAIFYNAVAIRFKSISNPQIRIKLVGAVIIRNSADEPFITNNLNGDKLHGLNCIYDLGQYVYNNLATLPPHDFFYLITARDMADDSWNSALAGLAFIGTVCITYGDGISYATGMGEDLGDFRGVHTCTHEIAHNLGAPHDNDTAAGTGACSWNDGYIMSYVGAVSNHSFFSSCSISKMSTCLATSTSSCVRTNISTTNPPGVFNSTKLPGDVLTMDEQCKRYTKKTTAIAYSDPSTSENALCYNLTCIYPHDTQPYSYWLWYGLIGAQEGSKCPSGKKCRYSTCV